MTSDPTEMAFAHAMREKPLDVLTRSVYADWLAEQPGRYEDAVLQWKACEKLADPEVEVRPYKWRLANGDFDRPFTFRGTADIYSGNAIFLHFDGGFDYIGPEKSRCGDEPGERIVHGA